MTQVYSESYTPPTTQRTSAPTWPGSRTFIVAAAVELLRFLIICLLVAGLLPELVTIRFLLAPLLLLSGGSQVALASALLLLAYDRTRFAPIVPILLIAIGLSILGAAAAAGAELSGSSPTLLVVLLAPGGIPYLWVLLPLLLWDGLVLAVLAGMRGAAAAAGGLLPRSHERPEYRKEDIEIVDALPPRRSPEA